MPKAIATTIFLDFAQAPDFMRLATTASLRWIPLTWKYLAVPGPLNAILDEMKNQ
jgi:hypothetical protein